MKKYINITAAVLTIITSLITIGITFYGFKQWDSFRKEKAVEIYTSLYDSCDTILKILSKPTYFEVDGYYPDHIPENEINKTLNRSKNRPYRLIHNEYMKIEKQKKNSLIVNDEELNQYYPKIEKIVNDILHILNTQDHPDSIVKVDNHETLIACAQELKSMIEEILKHLQKRIV